MPKTALGRDRRIDDVRDVSGVTPIAFLLACHSDEDGDGVYDVLEGETRGFKGPRVYDATGLPLHFDNQSIFSNNERNETNIGVGCTPHMA